MSSTPPTPKPTLKPTLAVIGAGAKAVAVAAKASVLRAMGVETPDVVAVERAGVGANWTCLLYTSPSPRDRS